MKVRKKLKEIYSQHEYAIKDAIFVIFVIALFIGGYFVSWKFIEKPLNDRQFELCEQVARDVYAQKGNVIVEASEDFSISTTTTVKPADNLYRGKVIVKLQNGELVMIRDMETVKAVFFSIMRGILVVLVTLLLDMWACEIYKKFKKNSGK